MSTRVAAKEQALNLFEQGIAKENIGKLSDAIQLYRQAYKLNESVDKAYRERLFSQETALKELQIATRKLSLESGKDEEVGEEVNIETIEEKPPCYLLELLTDDILNQIMKFTASQNPVDWFNFSVTCQRLSNVGFNSSTVWKTFSLDIYPTIYPNLTPKDLHHQAHNFYRGWKHMYQKKPFLKFGGVYISIVTYLREGATVDSLSWSNPIHIITYYRYVRFFRDGTCLRSLTVNEPNDVVPKLTKNWQKNGLIDVYNGFWSVEDEGKVIIEGEGSVQNYQFCQELQISGKRHHQLKWIRNYCITDENLESPFTLRNEKHFSFSRVKSWSIY